MTRASSYTAFGFVLLTSIFALRCAAPYHAIQPTNLTFDNESFLTGDSLVSISYRYDVLQSAGNIKYNELATASGISILGLRIDNSSDDTLLFPENFAFYDSIGLLEPLKLNETDSRINQMENNLGLDDMPGGYGVWFLDVPIMFNQLFEQDADKEMQKEFEDYYLVYSTIFPNTTVSGLVAFKVKSGTPLTVKRR